MKSVQDLFSSFVSNKDVNKIKDKEIAAERERKLLEPVEENLDYDPEGEKELARELAEEKERELAQALAEEKALAYEERQKKRAAAMKEKYPDAKENAKSFDKLVDSFWQTTPYIISKVIHELEVRFGTKGIKQITKTDYDNVICKLKSFGFTTTNETGEYMLRIQNEFLDPISGNYKKPNSNTIRTEITGFSGVQEYCKVNDIEKLLEMQRISRGFTVKFNKKMSYTTKDDAGENIYSKPVNFDDWNFRVSHQTEEELKYSNNIVRSTINKWNESKKCFRYINRVTFTHPDFPIKVDLSIVKSSKMTDRECILTSNIEEADLFNNPEKYEIELEIDNFKIGPATVINSPAILLQMMRKVIKYILMGLQGTNFPVSYIEQNEVLQNYMHIIGFEKGSRVFSKHFIGPSSCTLQISNIVPLNDNSNVPNIRNNYSVTDKADGERHMLIVSSNGRIYLINNTMKIIFTGAKTENKDLFNSIIDGELINHDKYGKFINMFAAFDIYFIKNDDVRSRGFYKSSASLTSDKSSPLRLSILKSFIKSLQVKSIIPADVLSPIKIISKQFYIATSEEDIFAMCQKILTKDKNGLFEYTTDGLIFTPLNMGVGMDSIGKQSPSKKVTWDYSFKWKPPQYNTIDFLVTTKKSATGQDIVTPIFQDGLDTSIDTQFNEYKSIVLRVGYDSKKDGYINPCQDVIDNIIPKSGDGSGPENESQEYYPVQFYPTDPYDEFAGQCNIMLRKDNSGVLQMYNETGAELFQDNTIVEFRYDFTKDVGWKWIPIKVRYDKTADLRNGAKQFGNSFRTANSNWKSIHNPISEDMISSSAGIPDEFADDNLYYNKVTSSKTAALRDFHNLYVKKLLISSVSKPGENLIDYAVGKAGDLPKWISAKLGFVFGIDFNKDCLENRKDGACTRYLNYRKSFKKMPAALFVNGNSGFNIKSGEAMLNDKAKQITQAVFGQGSKDEKRLGAGVFAQFGKVVEGFNISSCQFALHYFFENETVFQNYMVNLAECTKLNGYFIGTCYDGNVLFQKLVTTDCINMYDNDTKICEIKKNYTATTFENNISSLGYEIHVYQESIGKMYSEYLVNFYYLNRVMENYGFRLLTLEESHALGLPNSTGLFNDLYNSMIEEIKHDKFKQNEYGNAVNMTPYEKSISFLNRYFVYKKVRQIDAAAVALELLEESVLEPVRGVSNKPIAPKYATKYIPSKKVLHIPLPKAVNLHKTIRLLEDDEAVAIEEEEAKDEAKENEALAKVEAMAKEVVETKEVADAKVKKARKPRTPKALVAEDKVAIALEKGEEKEEEPVKKARKPRTTKAKIVVEEEAVVEAVVVEPIVEKAVKEKAVKEKVVKEKAVKEKVVKPKKVKGKLIIEE